MRSSLLVAVLILGLVGNLRAGDEAPFKLPGVLSIDTPGGGFAWSDVTPEAMAKVKGKALLCTKEGSKTRAVLTVEPRTADTEPKRVAALKGHYNGTVEMLQQGGYTNLKGGAPSAKPPIPDRVIYAISTTDPAGGKTYIGMATIFGKNTYAFQVFAPSLEEAQRFIQVVTTLKEG